MGNTNTTQTFSDVECPKPGQQTGNDFVKNLGLALLIINSVVAIILTTWYIARYNKSSVISKRDQFLVGTTAFGGLFMSVLFSLEGVLRFEGLPCGFTTNLFFIGLLLQLAPILIRLSRFYFNVKRNQVYHDFQVNKALEGYQKAKTTALGLEDIGTKVKGKRWRLFRMCNPSWLFTSQEGTPRGYVRLFASQRTSHVVYLIVCAIVVIIMYEHADTMRGCMAPCPKELYPSVITFITMAVCGPAVMLVSFLVFNEPDPLHIKTELIVSVTVGITLAIPTAVLTGKDPYDLNFDGKFAWTYIWVIGSLLEILLVLGVPIYYSYEDERQHKRAAEQEFTFTRVLKSQIARDAFKLFLISEFSIENFLFWEAVTEYNKMARSVEESRELRSMIIDTYVRSFAKLQVNLSYQAKMEALATEQNENCNETDFAIALNEVVDQMESDSFPRFTATKEFKALVWGEGDAKDI